MGTRRLATLASVLAVALAGCSSEPRMHEFSPGTWEVDGGRMSVTLLDDGAGSAVGLPFYRDIEDWMRCPEDGDFERHTGALTWTWDNADHTQVRVTLATAPEPVVTFATPQVGWSDISWGQLWIVPCGDPDDAPAVVLDWVGPAE